MGKRKKKIEMDGQYAGNTARDDAAIKENGEQNKRVTRELEYIRLIA